MYFVDTHTHIYDKEFDADRAEVVQRAVENGVQMMLLPNVDATTITPMLDTFGQFPEHCRVMMGLQPEEVRDDYKQVMAGIEKELEKDIYIGVGEIGLDFYWDTTFEKQQLEAFELQLDWAKQLHLPVSIHARNAFDKMRAVLEKKQDGGLRGVMHCFNGTLDEAKTYLDLGFHLGIGGVTTYKSCPVKDFLAELPLERIVLETDAPYLSPVPHRGKRNEPAFMVDTARRIAEIMQCSLEKIADVTTRNAIDLFNLKF